MSWESTALYYRGLNEGVKRRLGGLHSAKIVLVSVDFQEIERLQFSGDWDEAARVLAAAAQRVEAAGADFLLICANTMHKVEPQIAAAIRIPILHIADATAARITAAGLRRVGLLGTQFTREQDFYRGRLAGHGLDVLVPPAADREVVSRVIYEELCLGRLEDGSRREYLRVIDGLRDAGAEAVIAGCTEITMLVRPEDVPMPLFDTAAIHVEAAVAMALG